MNHDTLSKAERRKQGRALREKCSRSAHAVWNPRSRSYNIVGLLEESNSDRIPGLIAVRYGRMAQSPFSFFRGSAIIQARDLMKSPVSGITVQVCGDCHLMNFGGFATPERSLAFDINDFDETFPGPWEWDAKRLAVSIVLASRDRGFSKKNADTAVRAALETYRTQMSAFAEMKVLDIWYTQITIDDLKEFFRGNKDMLNRLSRKEKQARSRTSEAVFPKLTEEVDGRRRIVDDPPFIYHFHENIPEYEKAQQRFIEQYRASLQEDRRRLYDRYKLQDVTIKVVGVGSVGTRCFVSLQLADDDDPLFLQVKEARKSVLEPPGRKSRFPHQGERIVTGQRLMQAASDIFLGWASVPDGHDYYVRQLRDMKVSAEIDIFIPKTLTAYAKMCGWALARAHAKAGDTCMIAGYLGSSDSFDDALVKYAQAYADQVERDYEAFRKAIRSGRLHTDTDESSNLSFLL
jgi:uncharacterized protein (DUF2252 family)